MAEVLGTIASVITIAQTLKPVLSVARTVYKARNELEDVQVNLERYVVYTPIPVPHCSLY